MAYPPIERNDFATHSFYSSLPAGLETAVDIEEMTHLAVYGNTDGFPYTSGGLQIGWSVTQRFGLNAHYAAMHFEDLKTRHSLLFTADFAVTQNWSLFAGVQFLRGGDRANDLLTSGVFVRF